jgi:hypothetical protein
MGRHNDSGRNHPRGKATVCRPCNENKDARAECWHWQVLAGFDPQWPDLKLAVACFELERLSVRGFYFRCKGRYSPIRSLSPRC